MNGPVRPLGVYLHVPFCAIKCAYCDFFSVTDPDADRHETYVEHLIAEIAAKGSGEPAGTVFLGGGTPSLLAPAQLERILAAVGRAFRLAPDAEITLEANPETVDEAKLRGFRAAGANRVSFGVQSTDDGLLKVLGRIHSAARAREAVAAARAAGFGRVNADLMFGLPGQTPAVWERTLREVLGWPIDHLSAYEMTIEEGTAFGRNPPKLPTEDDALAMWETTMAATAAAGFGHYEVANYARPGAECRHNLTYWLDEDFEGFGAAAWGKRRGVRTANPRSLAGYYAGRPKGFPPASTDRLEGPKIAAETLVLNLRLRAGCDEAAYAGRYGAPPLALFGPALRPHLEAGRLERGAGRLRLTPAGLLVANDVWADLYAAA